MAGLREVVATTEETVVNDVATGMGYPLKKEQKSIVFKTKLTLLHLDKP